MVKDMLINVASREPLFYLSCFLTSHTAHGLVPEVQKNNTQEGVLCTRLHLVVPPLVPIMTVKSSLLGIFALKLPAILLPSLTEITCSVCQRLSHTGLGYCHVPCSSKVGLLCMGHDRGTGHDCL